MKEEVDLEMIVEADSEELPEPNEYEEGQVYQLSIESLLFDPDQPRKYFDENDLDNLKKSIESLGLLQAILFRKDESGALIVVAGERRVRAVRNNGGTTIPGKYFLGNYEEAALVENTMRVNLSPMEMAQACLKYKDKNGCTEEAIAKIIGKARNTVNEILSLNNLPDEIKENCINRNDLPRRDLVKIARTRNTERQMEKFNTLIEKRDRIARGERPHRQLRTRDRVEVGKNMIQQLTQKLATIRGNWSAEDIQEMLLDISLLRDELRAVDSRIEFLQTGVAEDNRF